MKKIEAVIRPERLQEVMEALRALSYPGLTVTEVRGHGTQMGVVHMWRGAEYRVDLLPKMKVEVVVLDGDIEKVVKAVSDAARTGSIGDGKIFISPVEDAIRVRTRESGSEAI
ncbi:MAG: P-II family nitrogen regulator [Candidatus Geothermincolia bacterium]